MHQLYYALTVIGTLIVLLSLFNRKIEGAPITEPLIAMLVGIAVGPVGLDVLRLQEWGEPTRILHMVCAVTLAMSLMATALGLPSPWLRRNLGSQLVLLLGAMAGMLALSTVAIWGLTQQPLLAALLLAAIITPNDPVVAATIISGPVAERYLPARLRHSIGFESGANDGLALPLVMLPLLLLTRPTGAWHEWAVTVVLYENLLGSALAFGGGSLIGVLTHRTLQRREMTANAFLSFSVALGFFVLGGMQAVQMNGVVGVFAAGLGFAAALTRSEDLREQQVQEMMERLFTIPVFVFFGAALPWSGFASQGWPLWALAATILLVRRMPVVYLLGPAVRELHQRADTLFVGWFGPIGVAALFYATHAQEKTGDPDFWVIPAAVIFSSTLVHGATSYPLVRWLSRRVPEERDAGPASASTPRR